MALILSIETAAEGCSVAIHQNESLLVQQIGKEGRSAAERLTVMIEEALAAAGVSLSQMDALAVSKGPGSYTGLRIGTSTAKGICYAADIPLIAVNTLDVMSIAQEVAGFDGLLCPMLDARRMEVYCKVFKKEDVIMETSALILEPESFKTILEKDRVLFFGSGSQKFREVCQDKNAFFEADALIPEAANAGRLAYQKYISQDFVDVADFEPFYLKEFMITAPSKSRKVTG